MYNYIILLKGEINRIIVRYEKLPYFSVSDILVLLNG
jgi:hypothetical protein